MTSSLRRGGISGGTVALVLIIAVIAVFAFLRFQRAGGTATAPGTLPVAFATSVPLEAAVTQAASSGKPMLLFFTADWCPPCKSLKKNALSQEAVASAITGKAIPVYIDCTSDMPSIGRDLGVEGYPTLMLVRNGKEISRLVGPVGSADIKSWLEKHAS
jgi:thioredoxin-like negative regulator of GroEL